MACGFDFSQKYCLVTGSSRGIGRAVAEALAAAGARVAFHGSRPRSLQSLERQLARRDHLFLTADLTNDEQVHRLADALAAWPWLDVLVHNAGLLGPPNTRLVETSPADWQRVLRVNLTAPFLLTAKLLPLLRRAPAATIIFVTSSLGRRGRAGWGAYAVSKFGVEGLCQVLAEELGPEGISVCALNPGGTRTAMRAAAFPEEDPQTLPSPAEIAPAFLRVIADCRRFHGRSLEARELLGGF